MRTIVLVAIALVGMSWTTTLCRCRYMVRDL